MASFPVNFHISLNPNPPTEPRNKNSQLHALTLSQDTFYDSASCVLIISTCTRKRDLGLGSCIHARTLKTGIDSNVFVSNSLLDMYVKCGRLDNATKLFDHMLERTVVSWTSIVSGYCQDGDFDRAMSIFWQMLENVDPNEYTMAVLLQACAQRGDQKLVEAIHCYILKWGFITDNFLRNSLIDAYAKSAAFKAAKKLVERLNSRDVVSWTSLISGSVLNGMEKEALGFFIQMQEEGVIPNEITILSILQACSLVGELSIFLWIHGVIVKAGWICNIFVINSLVELYIVNGYLWEGMKVFCKCCFTGGVCDLSPETMALLLQGYAHSGNLELGEQIHGYVIKHGFLPCIIVENSLIDMYAENEHADIAFQLFSKMSRRDIVSWNTMIQCLVKNGNPYEALTLLCEIHCNQSGVISPDFITILSSIQACSNMASLQLGQVIHGYIVRTGLVCDIFVQNSLIDLYAKSGRLNLVEQVFEEMPVRDLSTWNSIIAAFGINGKGISALQAYTELKNMGTYQLNAITFVNVLSACAHSGLVEEGLEIFNMMEREYGIETTMEHCACMVNLLGKSGRLKEAEDFIKKMPIRPGPDVWGALLGACGLFGDVEIAERAAKRLSVLLPEGNIWRVALSNVYASSGRWVDAAKLRAEMKETEGLKKAGGWSSIEVRGKVSKFMVGDTRHSESETIYKVLNGMKRHIEAAAMDLIHYDG